MIRYQIVVTESLDELEKEVGARVALGWGIAGSVVVDRWSTENERKGYTEQHVQYIQALLR